MAGALNLWNWDLWLAMRFAVLYTLNDAGDINAETWFKIKIVPDDHDDGTKVGYKGCSVTVLPYLMHKLTGRRRSADESIAYLLLLHLGRCVLREDPQDKPSEVTTKVTMPTTYPDSVFLALNKIDIRSFHIVHLTRSLLVSPDTPCTY